MLFSFVFIKYFSLTKQSYRCKWCAVCGLGSAVAATCVASIKREHSTDASSKLQGFFFFFFPCVRQKKKKKKVVDKLNFKAFQSVRIYLHPQTPFLKYSSLHTKLEPGRAIFGTRTPRMKRKPKSSHLSQLFLYSQLL